MILIIIATTLAVAATVMMMMMMIMMTGHVGAYLVGIGAIYRVGKVVAADEVARPGKHVKLPAVVVAVAVMMIGHLSGVRRPFPRP
jgi:hypothetical protein